MSTPPYDAQTAPWAAFKEWAAIVAALGAGAQTIILRKGGIAEGRGGFDPERAARFWFFPTAFHAQREKLKSAAAPHFPAEADLTPAVPPRIEFFAELVAHRFVSDREAALALDQRHLWTEATVLERFDWARPAGLHVLLVRVHRLSEPLALPAGLDLGGCKSWIELPLGDPALRPSSPALDDAAFVLARADAGF